MIDINRICLGCMREKPTAEEKCPYCGFDAENYKHESRWLPMTSILNGRYMLGKVLGEGGFGITYIGMDLNLQRRVAIKEYFPLGLVSREMTDVTRTSVSPLTGEKGEAYNSGLQKFMEEAQGVSQFDELDGIVTVKDFFFENATAYMVMEYLDGITLKEYLKEQGGKISGEQALEYMKPILEALQKVHEAGMIHRDISPDNIILTKEGKIKLIDFGSARAFARDENQTFTIMLKHGYAPPEQYQSKGKQGPWTDVYGICATLYKMITGKIPPNAMDRYDEDTLKPFSELEVGMPVYMDQVIIETGMALKAKDRWQSIEELYKNLYAFPIDHLLKEEADACREGGNCRWDFTAEPKLEKKAGPEETPQSEEEPQEDTTKNKKKQNDRKRTRTRGMAAAGAVVILAGVLGAGFYYSTTQKENEAAAQNTELSSYIGMDLTEAVENLADPPDSEDLEGMISFENDDIKISSASVDNKVTSIALKDNSDQYSLEGIKGDISKKEKEQLLLDKGYQKLASGAFYDGESRMVTIDSEWCSAPSSVLSEITFGDHTDKKELFTYIGCTIQEVCQDIDGMLLYVYGNEETKPKFLLKKDGLAFEGEYDVENLEEFEESGGDPWNGKISAITIAGDDSGYCLYGLQPDTSEDEMKKKLQFEEKEGAFLDAAGNVLERGKVENTQRDEEMKIADDGTAQLSLKVRED